MSFARVKVGELSLVFNTASHAMRTYLLKGPGPTYGRYFLATASKVSSESKLICKSKKWHFNKNENNGNKRRGKTLLSSAVSFLLTFRFSTTKYEQTRILGNQPARN